MRVLLRGPTPDTFWQWFGGIWLVAGALFTVIGIGIGVKEYRNDARLRTEGVVTSGMVLTKSVSTSRSGSSGSSSPTYHVGYRFTTADGQVVQDSREVRAETWDRLQERGPIEVRYLPGSPRTHRVGADSADFVLPLIMTGSGLVLLLLGGFVCWRAAGFRSSAREVGRTGVFAEATVDGIEPAGLTLNGQPLWVVRYRFQDQGGRAREGRSEPVSHEAAEAWRPGDTGTIRYDHRRPDRSVWVGRR